MCLITFRELCCKVCHISMKSLPGKTTYCRKAKRGVSNEGSPGVHKETCDQIEHATQPHYEGLCSDRGFCSRPNVRFNGLLDMIANRSGTEDQRSPETQQQDTVMQTPSSMLGHHDVPQSYYLRASGAMSEQHLDSLQPLLLRVALQLVPPPQAPIGTGRPHPQQTTDEKESDQNQNCAWHQDPFSVQHDPKTPAQDYREDGNTITQQQTPETDFRDAEACFQHGSSLEYNQRDVLH